MVKNPPAMQETHRSHRFDSWVGKVEGNGNLLQYSCLENPMDRGAWWDSPWGHRVGHDLRRSNQSILKEISPGISLEGMMLKLKLQYFGHSM